MPTMPVTPETTANVTWLQFEELTRTMGDLDYLEACDQLESRAFDAADAKREELKGNV